LLLGGSGIQSQMIQEFEEENPEMADDSNHDQDMGESQMEDQQIDFEIASAEAIKSIYREAE